MLVRLAFVNVSTGVYTREDVPHDDAHHHEKWVTSTTAAEAERKRVSSISIVINRSLSLDASVLDTALCFTLAPLKSGDPIHQKRGGDWVRIGEEKTVWKWWYIPPIYTHQQSRVIESEPASTANGCNNKNESEKSYKVHIGPRVCDVEREKEKSPKDEENRLENGYRGEFVYMLLQWERERVEKILMVFVGFVFSTSRALFFSDGGGFYNRCEPKMGPFLLRALLTLSDDDAYLQCYIDLYLLFSSFYSLSLSTWIYNEKVSTAIVYNSLYSLPLLKAELKVSIYTLKQVGHWCSRSLFLSIVELWFWLK